MLVAPGVGVFHVKRFIEAVRGALEAAIAVIWGLIASPPGFWHLAAFLFMVNLVASLTVRAGVSVFPAWGRAKENLYFTVRWLVVLFCFSAFGNTFAAFAWVIEASYIAVTYMLLQRILSHLSPAGSAMRNWGTRILSDFKEMNEQALSEIEDSDAEGDRSAPS